MPASNSVSDNQKSLMVSYGGIETDSFSDNERGFVAALPTESLADAKRRDYLLYTPGAVPADSFADLERKWLAWRLSVGSIDPATNQDGKYVLYNSLAEG